MANLRWVSMFRELAVLALALKFALWARLLVLFQLARLSH
jgi:hypothetical protein